jgi:Domain of unknown function (DUF5069)
MTGASIASASDLRQRQPHSPRCRLGGYVILPRMIDKGRATILGQNGQFNFDAPFDQNIVNFLGFDPAALLEQLAGRERGSRVPCLAAIDCAAPAGAVGRSNNGAITWFAARGTARRGYTDFSSAALAPFQTREDIETCMDLIDLDDFDTFGGKPGTRNAGRCSPVSDPAGHGPGEAFRAR